MNNKFISALVISGLAAAVGCSVKGGSVQANPPVIEPQPMVYKVTSGTLTPDSFSAMMWPKGWTEKETEERVQIINTASKLIVEYSAEVWSKKVSIEDLWDKSRELQCLNKFRDATNKSCSDPDFPDDDQPIACDSTSQIFWKTVPESAADFQQYKDCMNNYDSRLSLKSAIDVRTLPSEEKPDLKDNSTVNLDTIIKRVAGPDAKVPITSLGSSVVFSDLVKNPGALPVVVIVGFNDAKTADGAVATQTSAPENANDRTRIHDVSIDSIGRRLKFTVPDMNSWDEDAQKYHVEYQFDLSRIDNKAEASQKTKPGGVTVPNRDFAVFKGDVMKVQDGTVVQKGSGQIFGEFAAFSSAQ